MKKAKEIIKRGVVFFDASDVKADTDKIIKVVCTIKEDDECYELWYNECLSPMVLSGKQYKRLIKGKIVELHKGEVFIIFKG